MANHCSVCNKGGCTKLCAGCKDTPSPDLKGLCSTLYCSKECQEKDWPAHKVDCSKRKARLALRRFADLAQQIVFIFREATFDQPIRRVTRGVNGLRVHEGDPATTARVHPDGRAFANLTAVWRSMSAKEKATVLSMWFCGDALRIIHMSSLWLLKGKRLVIAEVEVSPKNVTLDARFVDCTKQVVPLPGGHSLLRITLECGEEYAIDITGAQFGWYDQISSWKDFASKHAARILQSNSFGDAHKFMFAIDERSEWNLVSQASNRLHAKMIQAFDVGMASYFQTSGLEAGELLRLKDADYDVHRATFLNAVNRNVHLVLHTVDPTFPAVMNEVSYELDMRGLIRSAEERGTQVLRV